MNAFDLEFWNGVLKGIMLAEEKTKETLKYAMDKDQEPIKRVLLQITELEEDIKNVHTSGIKEAIKRVKSSNQTP